MKSIIGICAVVLIASTSVRAEELLGGFHSVNADPEVTSEIPMHVTLSGFSGTISLTGTWFRYNTGSGDDTYGSLSAGDIGSPADTWSNLATSNLGGGGYLELTLVNGTSDSYALTSFSYDAFATNAGSPRGATLSITGGDLGTYANIATNSYSIRGTDGINVVTKTDVGSPPTAEGYNLNYNEFDNDLTGLSDNILGPGQSVTFRLLIDTPTAGAHLYLDNMAVFGEVVSVPESNAFLMVALGGLVLMLFRRNKK